MPTTEADPAQHETAGLRNNQRDYDRFEKLKSAQVGRGRGEMDTTQIAAEEVKDMRRREGRSKEDRTASLENFQEAF